VEGMVIHQPMNHQVMFKKPQDMVMNPTLMAGLLVVMGTSPPVVVMIRSHLVQDMVMRLNQKVTHPTRAVVTLQHDNLAPMDILRLISNASMPKKHCTFPNPNGLMIRNVSPSLKLSAKWSMIQGKAKSIFKHRLNNKDQALYL